MKTRFLSVFLVLVGFLFFATSCKKQVLEEETAVENTIQNSGPTVVNYFVDGQPASYFRYEEGDENVLAILGTEQDPTANEVAIHSFSSEAAMVAYADANHMPIGDYIAGGNELYQLAETNGVIVDYEQGGTCPQWYLDAVENRFPNNKTEAAATWYDLCSGNGGSTWISPNPGGPFMAPGWNDRVSSYWHFAIYGVMILYDRTFYRNRMLTFWNWGWQRVPLCSFFSWTDNRTSSSIH